MTKIATRQKIRSDFGRLMLSGTVGEVRLFRSLATAIESNTKSVYIEETHGASKANVIFDSAKKLDDRCEIADQLIFSISLSSKYARATFLQAKYANKAKWTKLSELVQLDFRAQSNQWYLLNRRPEIRGVFKFQPPTDLSSSFSNPAIGTYGVFYKSNNRYGFAFSIAEMISCSSPTVSNPKFAINGSSDKYTVVEDSAIVCMDMAAYLSRLFDFQIGAIIDPENSTHQWLINYVKAKARISGVDEDILSAIDSVLVDGFAHGDIPESTGDGVSLLIVLVP